MKVLFWFIASYVILWLSFYLGDTLINGWNKTPFILTVCSLWAIAMLLAIENLRITYRAKQPFEAFRDL